MAGVYLCNNDVFEAFSNWLGDSIKLRGETHPLTAHVSSFVKSGISKEQILEDSINVFLELVCYIDSTKHTDELMPMLVIPLGCSDVLCLWEQSVSLSSQISDESPSIFIFEREKIKYLEKVEEYKVPIDIGVIEIESENFNIYYRCFRDSIAIENDWEFNKAVYIEYYPDVLLS